MKLIFFIDSSRVIGGGEYAQFKFAQHLARRGHQVVIFAGDRNFISPGLSREKNLLVRYRHTVPLFLKHVGIGLINKVWSRLYEVFVVRSFMRTFRPDWVSGYLRDSARKAVRVGKRFSVPVANFVFETPPWMQEMLGERWLSEWSDKRFRKSWLSTRSAYASSDVLIPNSRLSGKNCKVWVPDAKVSGPVYPGVDRVKFKSRKRIYDFIYIGRLNALKNVDDLLKAAAKLRRKPKLVVVGDGEERANLQLLAKNLHLDVLFTGPVLEERKWSLLSSSKALVFPTSFEGFGMPPLEAMVAGCQVICSDLPIFKEVYGSNVHYFPLHDVDALSKVMSGVLDGKMTMEIPASFLKKFSWENAANTIETILSKKGVKRAV